MGKRVVSKRLRQEINSFFKRIMPPIDPDFIEKIDVFFSILILFLYNFREISNKVLPYPTTTERAMQHTFWREHCSVLLVATGSVSKRYQATFFAQLSDTLLENVKFDLICQILNNE